MKILHLERKMASCLRGQTFLGNRKSSWTVLAMLMRLFLSQYFPFEKGKHQVYRKVNENNEDLSI